ncbi:bifunctional diaminohydroxyphosphoribosylaminopyrimidine deaminase/5-amino-6-(5-phosphoribosylamino)uracil reductase RibD [Aureisphaera galaxeae]|uniref:bifunctional diaminohydroxyphosphoribosylaminopyrimidine deaminase/5-amino-6-(5-phosphoribosylamino)uracil reductase RibD n=1 Tax=Aureisphaera galaxeae TaxID=1538023 RepID=UPI002350AD86|nr:bifunctional diaminohydroxyphosphoribosylaminopyrimidine deaminase/5-amino-6-(5-phosphoribosylamino)uracil reductase RibD [Aureisphaera galaxeae]MDC8004981.1 bifunctional diaminohydroxyphosphoribosylaminopyrimidine deaminase/5-amino-6-(5-phosphoribosylamino)uracil reductase RibD [Aureisphaera galaxeae]
MTPDERYMSRCIQLAQNGLGTTYPNPMVGSVIVHNDKIIGEGWHQQAGKPHAEVNAIASVQDVSMLKDATIYVSLEPCSHFGKTPPCSDLIIEKGIKKVVIGAVDPNPKVAGAGIRKLTEAGCEVVSGVLEQECSELNKRFFTFHSEKRPYIILKWAQSADGFLAPAQRSEQKPVWITNAHSKQLAHKMRANEQAILVGTQTVLDDNPSLTTRSWKGESPIRVILDRSLRIPRESKVFNKDAPTLILNDQTQSQEGHLHFEKVDFSENLASEVCRVLYEHQLQSLIVEGGAQTLQTFIDSNLWDEAWVFKGAIRFEKGITAPSLVSGAMQSERNVKGDILTIYKNNRL